MCNVEDVKFLADIIEHVPLTLRARYTFSCAPINKKMPFVCTMFLKVRILFSFMNAFDLFLSFSMLVNLVVVNQQHLIGFQNKYVGHLKYQIQLWI
jgi:hypothetical protein